MPTATGYPEYWIVAAVIVVVSSTVWPPLSLLLMSGTAIFWFAHAYTGWTTPGAIEERTVAELQTIVRSENTLVEYDESLYQLLMQHLCIKEVINNVLHVYEDAASIIPTGALVGALHVPLRSTSGKVLQNVDFILTLPKNDANKNLRFELSPGSEDQYQYILCRKSDDASSEKDVPFSFKDKRYSTNTAQGLVVNSRMFTNLRAVLLERIQECLHHKIDEMGSDLNVRWPVLTLQIDKKLDGINMDVMADDGCHSTFWLYDHLLFMLAAWMNTINNGMNFWNVLVFRLGVAVNYPCPEHLRAAWLARQRKWPPSEIVDRVSNMDCHVVVVPGNNENSESPQIWQLRFTNQINLLSSVLHPKLRQCALVVKALLQEHSTLASSANSLDPFDEVVVHGVLKLAENMAVQDIQQSTRSEMIIALVGWIKDAVAERHMTCFFSDRDLFPETYLNSCNRDDMVSVLSDIEANLPNYLTIDLLGTVSLNINNLQENPYMWLTQI